MTLTQISIFVENRQGRVAHAAKILAEAGINIFALSLADTADFGILRLVVSNTAKAQSALKENGIICNTTPVLALEVPDVPGALSDLLNIIADAELSIEYMYAMRDPESRKTALVFRFENFDDVLEKLQHKPIRFITANDISN